MNGKEVRAWEEVVVIRFKILFQYSQRRLRKVSKLFIRLTNIVSESSNQA
jgi:hypothetical protein